jgi:hypothetical protein
MSLIPQDAVGRMMISIPFINPHPFPRVILAGVAQLSLVEDSQCPWKRTGAESGELARRSVHRSARAIDAARRHGDTLLEPAPELAVRRAEVLDRSRDDIVARHLRETAGDVVHEPLPRVPGLQAIEIAGLLELVHLARHLRVVPRQAGDGQARVQLQLVCSGPSNEFG